jgi:hypothetical protein
MEVRERVCWDGLLVDAWRARGVEGWEKEEMDWRVRSARDRVWACWGELVAVVEEGGRGKWSAVLAMVGEGKASGERVVSLDVKAIEERVRSAREGWRDSGKGRGGFANSVLVV